MWTRFPPGSSTRLRPLHLDLHAVDGADADLRAGLDSLAGRRVPVLSVHEDLPTRLDVRERGADLAPQSFRPRGDLPPLSPESPLGEERHDESERHARRDDG